MFHLKQINVITGGSLGEEGPGQLPPLPPLIRLWLWNVARICGHYISAYIAVYDAVVNTFMFENSRVL